MREVAGQPLRRRLPDTRTAITHKFDIAGHEGYLTVGLFEDGQPGELFITMAKEGSTIGGLMDSIGTLTSMALAIWRAAGSARYEIRASTFRAVRLHQEPGDSQRVVHHRLRVPLDGADISSQAIAKPTSAISNQPELVMPGLVEEIEKTDQPSGARIFRLRDDTRNCSFRTVRSK